MKSFLGRLRYGLLLVLFGLSSLALSLSPLLSSTVSATSYADDMIVPTDVVHTNYESCTDTDISTSWATTLLDTTKWNPSIDTTLRGNAITAYNDALENNVGWAVMQLQDTVSNNARVLVVWTSNDTAYTQFLEEDQYSIGYGPNAYMATTSSSTVYTAILNTDSSSSCQVEVEQIATYNGYTESPIDGAAWPNGYIAICDSGPFYYYGVGQRYCGTSNSMVKQFLVNTPIEYPAGYEGEDIPNSAEGENYHNLNFTANVSSYTVEYTVDFDAVDEGIDNFLFDFNDGEGENDYASFDNPNVHYYSTEGYDISCSIINGTNEVCSVQLLYTYPEESEVDQQACVVATTNEGHDRALCIDIKIGTAGTTTYTGTTNPAGNPSTDLPIVCGDWDIWCQVTQFIASLFNPNDTNIVTILTDFTTDNHGLAGIITAPIDAINSLVTADCDPLDLPIPYTGAEITLPCYYDVYEEHLGTVFTTYQTVVSGIIGYYVIVGILATVKGFKDPEENRIEVLKL